MKLTVSGKHLDTGDAFRTHIAERLSHTLSKYFGDAIDVNVTVAREGARFRATIAAHVGRNIEVFAEGAGHDPYPAFDDAAERLGKRLRRHKRRLRDHHKISPDDSIPALAYVLQPEDASDEEILEEIDGLAAGNVDAPPPVVAETATKIATLTVGEAVMRLDLSAEPALLFRNSAHGGLNMVYRRSDGTIGWVDPRESTAGRA